MQIQHGVTSAALVRHQLVEELRGRHLPDEVIDAAVLVASELVGNAIRHARPSPAGTLEVSWDVDASGVTVRVSDASTAVPQPRTARQQELGGRGLSIVAAVADDWGFRRRRNGKMVWAHVSTRVPASVG